MAEILHFRISSGLKNIIGRELINDKYIAIFELVKNSYDAGAKYARIRFDNLGTSEATITISDDGKGMSKEDIIKKWLFVAYSEKRNPSYRDNIKRAVAGAKGVGRFSCDRLGEHVCLSSKTASERILHSISISWSDFEKNQRIIAGNAQFTGIAAGRGVGFTTGLLHLRKGLGMRETPIRPHSWH